MIEALIQRLIEAGTPPLVAAVVVSEAFAAGASVRTVGGLSADETTERRRAYDRERQRLKRIEAKKSADSPPTSAESADADNNNSSSHKDSIEKKKLSKARPKKSADFLPDDWQPKESHFAAADRLKIPHSAVRDKAEDMRLWAKSNGVTRADWDATLHVFLRKDADKLRGANENPNSVHAAARRLRTFVNQFNEPIPAELCDGTGGTVVRMLPKG
jgi:hypothetical protein